MAIKFKNVGLMSSRMEEVRVVWRRMCVWDKEVIEVEGMGVEEYSVSLWCCLVSHLLNHPSKIGMIVVTAAAV